MSDRDFERICALARQHSGIVLGPSKRQMVYGRLARRLRDLGLKDFSPYCQRVERNEGGECEFFVNAITTNLTSFFREVHHFEYLQNELLPAHPMGSPLRVWSAGCSTGEEPWSIAIAVREAAVRSSPPLRLLATDIDSDVLATAASGVYSDERVQDLPSHLLKRHFQKGIGRWAGHVRVRPNLKDGAVFRLLNLMEPFPMRPSSFDIIFCRNVLIYFDKATQSQLFDKFADVLAPGGVMMIGHSETMANLTSRFDSLGHTIYKRVV